jgi:NTP pyrophosphatase (non-canonical NTP hydrolase)
MDADEYQRLSLIPASKTNLEDLLAFLGLQTPEALDVSQYQLADDRAALIMAALGLGGEAGEILDPIKKAIFHKHKTLDKDKLLDEYGDILWYVARGLSAAGLTMNDCMVHNVKKLDKRYASGFSHEASINRVA